MNTKKLLAFICVTLSSFLLVVGAQDIDTSIGTIQGPVAGDLLSLIERVVGYIRPLIAVAFLFVIIYGGFTRMTAAGDPEKEKKSNAILTAGIVGFAIIVLAPALVRLVSSLIGIQGEVI